MTTTNSIKTVSLSKDEIAYHAFQDLLEFLYILESSQGIIETEEQPMSYGDILFTLTDKGKEQFKKNGVSEDYLILKKLCRECENQGLLSIGKDGHYTWLMLTAKGLLASEMMYPEMAGSAELVYPDVKFIRV